MCGIFLALLAAVPACADSKNPADYPLRLHIFTATGVTFYHNRVPDETRGDGRANLFENGEARGADISFVCSEKVKPSFGFETYPAKWRKKGQELVVLFPVLGKSSSYFTCTLKTQLKDYAYFLHEGRLDSEPTAEYKAWMQSHDYDPEHGKNTPTGRGGLVPPKGLEAARQYLTGNRKDTDKASTLLTEIVKSRKEDASAGEIAWACIYLGYIADRAKNRQEAMDWYKKALEVENAPSGAVNVATFGLRQPLVWIRHLDAAQTR